MSGGELDLDAIEARAGEAHRLTPLSDDVLALVAEVRRLRARLDSVYTKVGADAMRRIGIDPP